MSKTSDLHVQQQENIDPLQAWNEYRAHGGKLDFTAWQEAIESVEMEDGVQCWQCGGSGCFEDECECLFTQDTCCCAVPVPPICDNCRGEGVI